MVQERYFGFRFHCHVYYPLTLNLPPTKKLFEACNWSVDHRIGIKKNLNALAIVIATDSILLHLIYLPMIIYHLCL